MGLERAPTQSAKLKQTHTQSRTGEGGAPRAKPTRPQLHGACLHGIGSKTRSKPLTSRIQHKIRYRYLKTKRVDLRSSYASSINLARGKT